MQLASADLGQRPGAVLPLAGTLLGILQAPPPRPPPCTCPAGGAVAEAGIPLPARLRGNQCAAAGKARGPRSLAWEAG